MERGHVSSSVGATSSSLYDELLLHGIDHDSKALRVGDWKLNLPPSEKMELNNLAPKHPERVKEMRKCLNFITMDAGRPGLPPPSSSKKKWK